MGGVLSAYAPGLALPIEITEDEAALIAATRNFQKLSDGHKPWMLDDASAAMCAEKIYGILTGFFQVSAREQTSENERGATLSTISIFCNVAANAGKIRSDYRQFFGMLGCMINASGRNGHIFMPQTIGNLEKQYNAIFGVSTDGIAAAAKNIMK